ncbi:putative Ig domain-containing protein [Pseudoduganella sp. R-34]|uniref:putative Ig domain-containing protein n=1 Tax=Pseudoduganella sp. R-34 TaxID=3404062 RepID=UPI003CF3E540
MRITNNVDGDQISDISVSMRVTDELGLPVAVTSNSSDTSAKFFVRISNLDGIASVDGTGVVQPKTTATIDWLMIPAPGAAGTTPFGKKYLVGATLKYKFQGEVQTLEVDPDVITVKPLPSLTLDYFMTQDVVADDPLTPIIESAEPFTLGVRVKNTGLAKAANLTIDSAQPKIVENNQGLLIGFQLLGSFVDDSPAQNSLLMKFGDIAGGTSKMGRWIMQTTLAGKFTEFGAKFSHADELGGSLTSLMQATNAHILLHDVRVDLPGRDAVRDYLASEPTGVKVFESNGPDSDVTDRSAAASLVVGPSANGVDTYALNFPATPGFAYVRLKDPYNGTRPIGRIIRSDAKIMAPENAWLSKTRNKDTKKWEYYVNFFDVATTGVYSTDFDPPSANDRPPELQFIADHTVEEGKQVSFIVEGSSAAGKPVALSAAPLPAGARFTQQPADPQYPGLARGVFDWTPANGSKGDYVITYTANDGARTAQRTAAITVTAAPVTAGPALPTIVSPLPGAHVGLAKPTFAVMPGTKPDDSTTKLQFELYADAGHTQLLATAMVDKAPFASDAGGTVVPAATNWTVPVDLDMSTKYWWRVRSFNGTLYSPWLYGRFENPVVNDELLPFNLVSPAPGAEVSSVSPGFTWFRTGPKQTGLMGATEYTIQVYKDAALTTIARTGFVMADPMGHEPSDDIASGGIQFGTLTDNTTYYWRVIASADGVRRVSTARAFTVRTGNKTPTTPKTNAPLAGSVLGTNSVALSVANAVDPEGAPLTYIFEIDNVKTFDSAAKRVSGAVAAGSSNTEWIVDGLQENTRYWWRAKASDGKAESDWGTANFFVSAANDAPSVPVLKNPGNGAWTSQLQPTMEIFPARDPEGGAVRYEFELYKDAGLTQRVCGGISSSTGLICPASLQDKSPYWWRARAIDAEGMASAWSATAQFTIQSGPMQLAAPSLITPARRGTVSKELIWEGLDPEREQLVSLYYGTTRGDFVGTPIVEGLRQPRGATGGRYSWNLANPTQNPPPPGAYQLFMVVQDGQSVAKAYAPGSVVVPASTGTSTIKIGGSSVAFEGLSATYGFSQTIEAGKDISYATSGPAYLVSYNYLYNTSGSTSMAAAMIFPYQCSKQQNQVGSRFRVYSEDTAVAGRIVDIPFNSWSFIASNTGDETLRMCEIKVISERKIDATQSEFTVTGRLSNLGPALTGAVATPVPVPGSGLTATGVTAASGTLTFGAIGSMDTGATQATVTVKGRPGAGGIVGILLKGLKWSVQVTR